MFASIHERNSTIDTLLEIVQRLFEELFFSTQIDGYFRKEIVLLEKILRQDKSMRLFET